MKPQPREEGQTFTSDRLTPAEMYINQLDGEYYRLSEVAEQVGISPQTLRRLIKSPKKKVNAPSYVGHQGNMPIYVFSKEDLEEIRDYYQKRYEGFDAPAVRGQGRPKSKKD